MSAAGTPTALLHIADERANQVVVHGWTPEHDDKYAAGELADAAACYAMSGAKPENSTHFGPGDPPVRWPWDDIYWKPQGRRRDLVRAGALIVAEIERLDRAAGLPDDAPGEVTSARVGHIAAIGLHAPESLSPEQIKAVCASALTQRPDHPATDRASV